MVTVRPEAPDYAAMAVSARRTVNACPFFLAGDYHRKRGGSVTRSVTRLLLAVATGVAVSHAAAQGGYPEKPIRVLIGFPAGSTADVAGRLIGQKWSEAMGKPVVVENLAGAAGNIALERVVKATPDGYTLALAV